MDDAGDRRAGPPGSDREVWLPTAGEMAELDRRAVESGAIPERGLIESAGREIAHQVDRLYPEGPVAALAGSGHNGADALVALRTLSAWGREVRAVECGSGPPEPDVLRGWGIELLPPERLEEACAGAAAALDGILGTGVRGAPRSPQAEHIERLDRLPVPVVAVDGPSGVDFTTGAVPGACARAELTLALGWPKLGLLLPPAREHAGEIRSLEIGFPPPPEEPGARAVTAAWAAEMLERRRPGAHKGEAGYLSVVAGQEGMAGASVLASRAASRAGAGIVRTVGDPANRIVVQSSVPEGLFSPWSDPAAVEEALEWADAVAAGPGMGRGPERRELVERILDGAGERPVLLDADALNAWEGEADALADRLRPGDLVTPHPGELSRLLGTPVPEITGDPAAAAREAGDRLGAVVLLKGEPTVVAGGEGPLRVSPFRSPALAAGGTGDVLAGAAGALLAAGASAADAAAAALALTGIAAERSGAPVGRISADLPDELPAARRAVLEGRRGRRGPVNFRAPSVRPA